jgi:hypothetical protein
MVNADPSLPAGFICFVLAVVEIIVIATVRKGKAQRPPEPLSSMGIFWSVFGALWLFLLSGVTIFSVIGAFASLAAPIR